MVFPKLFNTIAFELNYQIQDGPENISRSWLTLAMKSFEIIVPDHHLKRLLQKCHNTPPKQLLCGVSKPFQTNAFELNYQIQDGPENIARSSLVYIQNPSKTPAGQ